MFINFQCAQSDLVECPVVVKTEVDSITVKEESPVEKVSPDECVTQEGGKTLDASKQHESQSQSDTSEHSSDECNITEEKSEHTVETVSDPSENEKKFMGAQELHNSELPVENDVKDKITDQPQEIQDSQLSAHSEKSDAEISKEGQDEASAISNITPVSKESETSTKEKPREMTPTLESSNVPVQQSETVESGPKSNVTKTSEMSDCIDSSKDHVQESENDQSEQSPVSIHNSKSDGHSHLLDEDEAINLCMDDDDINMSPGDIVQVYAEVNRIKNFPRYQLKSCQETILDIVISSVGLMRYLVLSKKLSKADIEKAEDLITDIHMENTRKKLITSGGHGGRGINTSKTWVDSSSFQKMTITGRFKVNIQHKI